MGGWLALLSDCYFAAQNMAIMSGAGAKGQDNGAFLSILLMAGIPARSGSPARAF